MKKFLLLCAMLFAFAHVWAQERTVSGKVTSEEGETLPGVNVVLKGTNKGTVTDFDGNYKLAVPSEGGTLVFSFIGLKSQEVEIGSRSVVDVKMASDVTQLSEVVVTALGIEREERTIAYATQEVNEENLNITQSPDIKSALAGKVAGVQINGQAGSKLGQFGKIRIRGAISLTNDNDPLYIVDGVPTPDPNDIDMNNVASVNILKGPAATSLYGQRAESGVVVITTKKGSKQLSVEVMSSTTMDRVAYLPKYQNLYGRGYDGEDSWGTFDMANAPYPSEWEQFQGKRYIQWDNNYADESWGPRFDGEEYVPWYAFWPESPYYGQTAKWEAQPNNIKDFYETGITAKNTVAVSGGSDLFTARLAYTNLNQGGITPYTEFNKHYLNSNVDFNASEKLRISSNIRFSTETIEGDYGDGYGNQTSGSFNSWFAREVNMDIMKELKDLQTMDGYSASWNWWGPDYYAYADAGLIGEGFKKAAFWFNPYTFMEQFDQTRNTDNFAGNLTATYNVNDNLDFTASASRNYTEYKLDWFFPFFLSNSAAPELYNAWINSFGRYRRTQSENNYNAAIKYNNRFGEIDVAAFAGGNIRKDEYQRIDAQMNAGAKSGGLIIPDLYTFSNAGIPVIPETYIYEKQVNSLYGNLSLGFRDFIYLDASYRKDWSSALPSNNNGYGYPSVGLSLIFSEMLEFEPLSYGKFRASFGQVGSDVDALLINPIYQTGEQPFMGENILMYKPNYAVDPNLRPSLNTAYEVGFDVRFIDNRIGLSATYYDETRKDDIIPVSVSRASGYNTYLTNAGEVNRKGIELVLDGQILKMSNGLTWDASINFSTYNATVQALPGDLTAITGPGGTSAFGFVSVIHELGEEWGQLRGTGFARDENGNKIIQSNGLYATEQNQYFGSVIPDFTGGILNRIGFKGFSLAANIDFQKGGNFFSLSENWGYYSGLLEETAAINDRGSNVRDDVAEGGGVHVTGVDANGNAVDEYVNAFSYFGQWYSNRLAEPFIHDASFIKLRELSLSYDFSSLVENTFIRNATLSVVGRNLALLAVSEDNYHRWDPSELSQTYGEDGQLPGTRSYGINVRLTF